MTNSSVMSMTNSPEKQITLTAEALSHIAQLCGAAGFVSAGTVFHVFKNENPGSQCVCWNFINGSASMHVSYDIEKRVITYHMIDFEDKNGDIDIIRPFGPDSRPGSAELFGAAAALRIPVVCTGKYFESENDDDE